MNKILREEMEYLIRCDDKAITPDVKDDVKMTLDYIDELENKINKAIEQIKKDREKTYVYNGFDKKSFYCNKTDKLLNILEGNEEEICTNYGQEEE